jgi:hypothetical protein
VPSPNGVDIGRGLLGGVGAGVPAYRRYSKDYVDPENEVAEQGERRKAHDLLAPVYGWFTEGFETADFKDAKALLDELA